ncbi:hypothetical protein A3K48_02445 [candidate division WOR-1 bacterium RIFOXYA12_FULL_52_29]|uniref:Oligosaccharide repeat unit polymerase n=1 Tax=candidate division WOR-1 bacterium RIFOXYC12_FULL_54_18 TaxID=1802584 RepID=A0A1F4T5N2_UNCSA|nr:MAG: hypothetical protein A3K44_02445 [candidate division WOR-1 bacterium RIFOXYA2_FULL_51_19]OGC17433.1 MAG: hypothetical protein A3K48_02445 [candidate division WOR-1 bacterium RIFOXYA12_FULL_52_29]OGC26292.1 MAG: hypothetical protein A3K32_02440 [candidate division WOR-1 bacterium RIFOXYB2_FULL_45_9]OGC27850.1 MAG: hypothetical protein A3K49_02445 [candidate division WOR-1 bacterium RIFOXYC12_FULL_54_18]OGC29861.1 MAG: hypothetical protein A2346_03890 [candidate division WOR-1 bacterium R
MENAIFVLILSAIFYVYVYIKRRPGLLSLYSFFGIQWLYYWLGTYLIIIGFFPNNVFGGMALNNNGEVVSVFLLFNALSLFVFSLIYLVFGRIDRSAARTFEPPVEKKYAKKHVFFIFLILTIFNVLMLVLSVKTRYMGADWLTHSINANIRNVFVGVFIYYMLVEKIELLTLIVFLGFCFSTFLYGGRMYLLVATAAYMAYLFNRRIINVRHLVILGLVGSLFLSAIALYRSNIIDRVVRTPKYLLMPIYADSVFSAYPALYIIDRWQRGGITYYTMFTHYLVDSVLIYVPNFVYAASGENKIAESGLLASWQDDNGGIGRMSPQGGFHYIAEAMAAGGFFGIIAFSALLAFIFIFFERMRRRGLSGQFFYYSFLGVAGVDIVSEKFAWCFRYFTQNVFSVLLLIFIVQLFSEGAVNLKRKRALALERSK